MTYTPEETPSKWIPITKENRGSLHCSSFMVSGDNTRGTIMASFTMDGVEYPWIFCTTYYEAGKKDVAYKQFLTMIATRFSLGKFLDMDTGFPWAGNAVVNLTGQSPIMSQEKDE